jgi:nucleotide-binding universal stress UspA family protein
MKYVVGIDLIDSRGGVPRFAAWFRRAGGCRRLLGVHVVPHDQPATKVVVSRALTALESLVEREGLATEFDELCVVPGNNVAETLHAVCVEHSTAGLIVGRRSGVNEPGWVRRGSTTRYLLRSLPAPIIVVPPDLDLDSLGSGPLLVTATAAEDASMAAIRVASQLSRRLQRNFEVVRVAPQGTARDVYLPVERALKNQEEVRRKTELGLSQWLGRRGIDAPARVLSGPTIETLLARIAESQVPLAVCGRNRATFVQRYLGGSTATELAALSNVPVAVVAPTN